MICCPFHADRNPSMKVDFRFHCFGCGADGDVIDFAAKLFQLSLRQAAEKLASDFGLSATGTFPLIRYKLVEKPLNQKEQFYKILCGYRSLLADWRMAYAPKNPEASLHPCFVASLQLCRPCAISAGYSFAGKPTGKTTTTQRKGSDRPWRSNRTMQGNRRSSIVHLPETGWVITEKSLNHCSQITF